MEGPVDNQLVERIERWRQKLLDFSMKNPLLSLRSNAGLGVWTSNGWALAQDFYDRQQPFQIVAYPISELGGVAAALHHVNKELAEPLIAAPPALTSTLSNTASQAGDWEAPAGVAVDDIIREQMTSETHTRAGRKKQYPSNATPMELAALEQFSKQHKENIRHVVVDADHKVLQDQLARMERTNRLKEDEAGIHVLFWAVGMVKWTDGSKTHKIAPLILIPVSLVREHARDPFILHPHDDEIVLNPALEHLLTQQYAVNWEGVRNALAADRLNFRDIGLEATKALDGVAEVIDEGRLCLLSYAKHHMWADLSGRGDALSKHPVVRQIVGDKYLPNDLSPPIDWQKLDEDCAPDDLFLPLPADASQIRAISRVDRGESLVIQGPPGTGKSQTIANMISHLLASGKRVLFVAEKLTALGVVHERLNELGLGPFCLELHTQSSSKARVLQQLQDALEARNTPTVHGYHEAAMTLQQTRMTLNNSLNALHEEYPNGMTIYHAIGRLTQLQQAPIISGLMFPNVLTENVEEMMARKQAAVRYAQALRLKVSAASVFDPWRGLDLPDNSTLWQDLHSIMALLQQCKRSIRNWPTLQKYHTDSDITPEQWSGWARAARAWVDGNSIPSSWKKEAWAGHLGDALDEFETRNKEWMDIWAPYHAFLNRSVLKENPQLWQEFLTIDRQWIGTRWMAAKKWRKLVEHHEKQPCEDKIWKQWCLQHQDVTNAYRAVDAAAKQLKDAVPADQKKLTSNMEFNDMVALARHTVQWCDNMHNQLGHDALLDQAVQAAIERDDALVPRAWHQYEEQQWLDLQDPWTRLMAVVQQYDSLLRHVAVHVDVASEWNEIALSSIEQAVAPLIQSQSAWTSWRTAEDYRQHAMEYRLEALVDAVEMHQCPWDAVEEAMDATYATAFVNAARMSHPEWVSYQGAQREIAIKRFQEESDRFEALTRKQVVSQMAERLRAVPIDEWTDMIVLKREMMKKTKHLATRKLIRRMPQLLPVLKPCLMMSPLSVAEYLSHEVPDFDVVIFDEASQIPTADAIGALSRGKQVVVVGDPKQMPPSRLFSGDDDLDDKYDEHVDLDSILTECLGSGMKSVLLNWHYRSRHEQLIAFSNKTYYGGNLITFPSPDAAGAHHKGLFVHDVNGLYDRGGSGTNIDEARAVVEALTQHVEGPCRQSIGVVTFNQKQQALIEGLWDKRLIERPDLEERILMLPQTISIKNLESVQGDERDVVLFSTTFGKDPQGRFMLNFGPLGQLGGERRLNVAITRARDRMEIFSSFHPNEIDPARISHQGIRDMREWLLFARTGQLTGALALNPSGALPDSPFEVGVIAALAARGWVVHPQVGCSGYRIDLAVVHPNIPSRYLAGIECDGATYHSFKTARDRDKQRQIILENLGWSIVRIWSTDWFEDQEREIDRVHDKLLALAHQTN